MKYDVIYVTPAGTAFRMKDYERARQTVMEVWENLKPALMEVFDSICEKISEAFGILEDLSLEEVKVSRTHNWHIPRDTSKASQVLNRKPMHPRIRNSI